jgi:general L-amino acid transport system substrate-binding protein
VTQAASGAAFAALVIDCRPRFRAHRELGIEGNIGHGLRLDAQWVYRIISRLGNYGEIFDRNVGRHSPLKIKRGLNAPWVDGGLLYSPPMR